MSSAAPFDPEQLFATLATHGVEFVLVGALAARLQGFPRLTADADLTPNRTQRNLERLAAALRSLDARVYTESIPEGLAFDCSAAALDRADIWNLVSTVGRIDVIFRPAGTDGYHDLLAGAVAYDIHGARLYAASLRDILRSKVAADRPQDRQDALIIREMLAADEATHHGTLT
ncbi:MAG: hypothetical protein ABJC19_11425 [Gemmatimonadota bacterium]